MRHPYKRAAPHRIWRQAVAGVPPHAVDPVVDLPIKLTQQTPVVAAGSCFAQHIGRYLRRWGFNFLVTEPAHPIVDQDIAERFQYGVFSARHGNIYTSRQLVQLFKRAYGTFTPSEDIWPQDGAFLDPFRPTVHPGGFATEREYRLDREHHFAAVRQAFEAPEVFIFTLGLTECWRSRDDGAAYPICPGVSGGRFDPERYEMVNLGVSDVVADLDEFQALLKSVNPQARIILTVSPVPLAATAEDRHVLVATTYSKSVLRVAADEAARRHDNISYFPSYEVITGSFNRGRYYAEDLREVTEEGVRHVMSLFRKHATVGGADAAEAASKVAPSAASEARDFGKDMDEVVEVLCDEAVLGAQEPPTRRRQ